MPDNYDNLATLKSITRREAARWTIFEITGEKITDGVIKKTKIPRLPSGRPMPFIPNEKGVNTFELTKNTGEFHDVIEACRKNPNFRPAFWFIEEDGLVVMDVDAPAPCPDYPTYTERSISPGGYHMLGWFKGACPNLTSDGIKETFRGPHWIVLTGDVVDGKNTINDMTDFFSAKVGITYKEKGEPYKFDEGKIFTAGEREPEIFRMAGSFKGKNIPLEAAIAAIQVINKKQFVPPHTDDYVAQRVRSAYKRKDSKAWTEEVARRKDEEEQNKLVDLSGIIKQITNLSTPKYINGFELGPEIDHEDCIDKNIEERKLTVPPHLLKIPGVLQHVVDYYNETSIKDQPQFAVQTAIAVGSMVTQRRYKTDQNNYTSLNLINVGDTSTGKEHGITTLQALALEAGLNTLIGPSGYTSAGGVFTALYKQPAHISIIDELGRLLGASKKSQNSNADRAQTTIMEIFGRLGGTLTPEGYSKMTDKTKNADDMYILHPALTIYAMTTPDTLYENLSINLIKDGYMPRFLVVETQLGRQMSKKIKPSSIDKELIDWMKRCADNEYKITDPQGKFVIQIDPHNPPDPILIPFDPSCDIILENYERYLINKMDSMITNKKYSDIYGKTREMVMRLSLIIAISCGSLVILPEHLNWSKDYIDYYTDKLVERLGYSISDSELEKVTNEILRLVKKSGTMGITDREISQRSNHAKKYPIDTRLKKIMPTLEEDSGIRLCLIKGKFIDKEKKKQRYAWVTEDIAKQFDVGSAVGSTVGSAVGK